MVLIFLATVFWKARRTFLPASVFASKADAGTPASEIVAVMVLIFLATVPAGAGVGVGVGVLPVPEANVEDFPAAEAYVEAYAEDFPAAEAYAEVDPELYAMAAGSTSSIPMRAERIMTRFQNQPPVAHSTRLAWVLSAATLTTTSAGRAKRKI